MPLTDAIMTMSDESTDDASENGDTQTQERKNGPRIIKDHAPLKNMVYRDRLEALKRELQELETGTHKGFIDGVAKLEEERVNRYAKLEVTRELEVERLDKAYKNESLAHKNYFEKQKIELKESLELVIDLENKRLVEERKHPLELEASSSSTEVKTKPPKERERRRRGSVSLTRRPDIRYKIPLKDEDVEADLQTIANEIVSRRINSD